MKKSILETQLKKRFKEGFDLIQVILGPRQVGKTTSIQNLLSEYKGAKYYVSAESKLTINIDWIDEIWQIALNQGSNCLLVIDEIQKVPNWSERIKTLWDQQKQKKNSSIKLILLGSSSVKIQQGLTESLTGRFELIRAYHWSFQETQLLKKMSLKNYLLFGGYPGSYKLANDVQRFLDYIQNSIVNTVIERDLLSQGRIRNPALFKQTFELLQALPASEISYTKLLGQLQDKGNTDLIKNYLNLYEGAFLFTQIHKFNNNAFKSRLSTPKIICMAPALLDFNHKGSPDFLGRCFESLVGSDLIRSGLAVYYWREGDHELDYIIKLKSKLIGLEVKSQKNKSSKSVSEFKKNFPAAHIVYINFENYENFAANPKDFLNKMCE